MKTAFWYLYAFPVWFSVLPKTVYGVTGTYLLGLGECFSDQIFKLWR